MNKKIAIVGSEESYWKPDQTWVVLQNIVVIMSSEIFKAGAINSTYTGVTLVSGHCPKGGVDIWAESVADTLHIKKLIFKPEVNQWSDKILYDENYLEVPNWKSYILKGYKSRNIQIAEACDVLYCIDPKYRGYRTGGKWTMNYAQKLGKETHLVEID